MRILKKPLFLLFLLALVTVAFSACGKEETSLDPAADERVAEAYTAAQSTYEAKSELVGFWEISAAYAVLDEAIYDKTFDLSDEDENQRGAIILSLIMMGKNPYDDNGTDRVTELLDHGVSGSFAIPVLNFIGLQAAGAPMDEETVAAYIDYCCEQLTTLSMGPDTGGWAAVAVERYLEDPLYQDQVKAAIDAYVASVSEDLAAGTMGSAGITYGCVVTGLTALTDAGLSGYDVTKDAPWTDVDPLGVMYENLTQGEENVSDYYQNQYNLEFADFYRVIYEGEDMAWQRCGVNGEKLSALIAEAEALKSDDTALNDALTAAKAIPEEQMNALVPGWGSSYYALYDAVQAAK